MIAHEALEEEAAVEKERRLSLEEMIVAGPFIIWQQLYHDMRQSCSHAQTQYLLKISVGSFQVELRELGAQQGQIGHA